MFDKYINELIGFVDLGDVIVNYVILDNIDELVIYVFVFYVRGLVIEFKFCVVYFVIIGVIFY